MMAVCSRWSRLGLALGAGFVLGIGFTAGSFITAQDSQTPRAPATFKAEEPAYRGLDANLFMQTAAEYRACCYQAYNLATIRLREECAAHKDKAGKLAVVLDLDETVLDNAGFQAMQLRSNLAYDQRLWDVWEEKQGDMVGLVPGAKDFILEAGKLGVVVVYISNRNDKFREQTKAMLKRLGIPIENDAQLKLATNTSDKTERRKETERDFNVLLYVGDNLRDFDEKFRCRKLESRSSEELEKAIKERSDKVDETRMEWGRKWIILPNTAYGEWMKPLGSGKADLERLVPAVTEKK
jgi:5'-nucleotidase (lipoprotein e(P4) family)